MSARVEITTVFRIAGAAGANAAFTHERSPPRSRVAERQAETYGRPVPAGRRASPAGTDQERRHEQPLARLRECLAAQDLDGREEEVLIVSGGDRATLETAKALFELLCESLCDLHDADMPRLIELAMPMLSERTSAPVIYQARRNASLRAEFVRTCELLDAEQVHTLYGSSAKNRAALAARWRADRKIFAVEHHRRLLYPAFQFDDVGRPKAVVGRILKALGPGTGPWQTAIWFTTPNSWIDHRRPLALLDREPDRVIDAAEDVSNPAFY
jgi:hypothetical protein